MNFTEFRPIDPHHEHIFKEISRRIFRLQSGKSLDSMEKIGANTNGQIGASYLSLKTLAQNYSQDLETALLLWGTGKREEQIVACFLIPNDELIKEKITQLLDLCHSLELAEYFGTLVLSRCAEQVLLVNEFLQTDNANLQIAALACISRNRIIKKTESPFTDNYIRGINTKQFKSPYVLNAYNRLRILV